MSPNFTDKIIINSGNLVAYWEIIKGWFKGVLIVMQGTSTLADEIEGHGWSQDEEAKALLRRQEAICATVDAASEKYITALRKCHVEQMKLTDDTRLFIDKKLAQTPQP